MAKEVIHISEAEALSTGVATLLSRVRAGAQIVIERDRLPFAVLQSVESGPGRLLSESPLAKARDSTAVMDADFAKDLEAAIECHREPLNPPEWD